MSQAAGGFTRTGAGQCPTKREETCTRSRGLASGRRVDRSYSIPRALAIGARSCPAARARRQAVRLPVVSLRDAVVFPEQRSALSIGRLRSMAALARSVEVLVLTQRDSSVDEPGAGNHFPMGCVAELLRGAPRGDGGIDVMLRGLRRARADSLEAAADVLEARVDSIEDESLESDDTLIREVATRIALVAWGLSERATLEAIGAVHGHGRLADVAAIGPARLSLEDRLELLEELRPAARVGRVLRDARGWNSSRRWLPSRGRPGSTGG